MNRLAQRILVWAPLAGLAGALVLPPQALAQGSAERGRAFAAKHCTRCHVVGDINPTGGISSTPSFQLLVRRRPDYQYRFQTFFERRPHPAFVTLEGERRHMAHLPANAAPIKITIQNIEDLAAFVETLKPDPNAPREPFAYRPRPKPRMR